MKIEKPGSPYYTRSSRSSSTEGNEDLEEGKACAGRR
jgi:hypothetical protein